MLQKAQGVARNDTFAYIALALAAFSGGMALYILFSRHDYELTLQWSIITWAALANADHLFLADRVTTLERKTHEHQ